MFFYAIGILSLLVVMVHLILALFGFGGDGGDIGFDPEIGDIDHGGGVGFLSSQTIAAFLTAFGWVGVVCIKRDFGIPVSVAVAMVAGFISMYVMYAMLRSLMRLQHRGNLEYSSAVGEEAVVYVTIPGSDRDGGQIEVTIQGRSRTAGARSAAPGKIKPGQRVRITGMLGATTFAVEEIKSEANPGPAASPATENLS
ncbi:MAG: NfeD family protein [Akkermansiaceae bacterium]|nr:NfeD family protein [Akkermansiaceae bacterium]